MTDTFQTLPSGYTACRPRPDDAAAVTALIRECELHEAGEADTDLDAVQNTWSRPRFELITDAWLVEAPDGTFAAYGDVWPRPNLEKLHADGFVRPAHRGRGLGRWLVRAMEARAREMVSAAEQPRPVPLTNIVSANDTAGGELLAAEGYSPEEYFWQMRIELAEEPPATPLPDGITVRTYQPGDERAIHALVMTAFGDNYRHVMSPFEEWQHFLMTGDTFDPNQWFLAMDGDRIAAVALCPEYPHLGWIRQFAVARDYRRRGLGLALLHHVFRALRAIGKKSVGLGVDSYNRSNARALYERAGMHLRHEYIAYEKVVNG